MILSGCSISRVFEVVGAFFWGEGFEELSDALPGRLDGSLVGFPEQRLEFGEELLDRVEVRAVLGQEDQVCAGAADGAPDCGSFVAAEIVHDHDLPGLERGDEKTVRHRLGSLGHRSARRGRRARRSGPSARAARKVSVRQWPCGTEATSRCPSGARPCVRVMFVLTQVSSMKMSRFASILA